MSSSKSKDALILQFGLRRVIVLREQCLHYSVSHPCRLPAALPTSLTAPLPQDVLALGLSTFASLTPYNIKTAVILGGGRECPWEGNLELTEKTWEAFRADVTNVIIVFRSGSCPVASKRLTKSFTASHQLLSSSRESVKGKTPMDVIIHIHTLYVPSGCVRLYWLFVTKKEGIPTASV